MRIEQVIVNGPHQVDLVERDIPDKPAAGEILIETEKTFISAGTELANYTALDPSVHIAGSWNAYPWAAGYSNVGRIVAVGKDVVGFTKGDRVWSFGNHASYHYVSLIDLLGMRTVTDESFIPPLIVLPPDDVSSEVAVAAEMAGIAISALRVSTAQAGDSVAVFGLGLVGNLCAQFFQTQGCRVYGIDPMPARRKLANKVGITNTLTGTDSEVRDQLLEITNGDGVTVAIDAVGDYLVVKEAASVVAQAGEVIFLGSQRAEREGSFTDVLRPVHWKHVRYIGALEWQFPLHPTRGTRHSTYSNIQRIYELIADKKIDVESLISHRMKPKEIKLAYDSLLNNKDHYWGVVLDWTSN